LNRLGSAPKYVRGETRRARFVRVIICDQRARTGRSFALFVTAALEFSAVVVGSSSSESALALTVSVVRYYCYPVAE